MRINSLLALVTFFTVLTVSAQKVRIPDENFKRFLVQDLGIDENHDEEIQVSEAKLITKSIDCSSKGIKDLTGIEAFVFVKWLNCNDNQLTELDISKNVNLTQLRCTHNSITELDVSKNEQLKVLWCGNNPLTNIDVSSNLELRTLSFLETQIKSFDVSANKKLIELYCSGNKLGEIDVSGNTNLLELQCDNTELTTLDVSKNVNLNLLWCGLNQLGELDISKNVNLEALKCERNKLKELDLSNCKDLLSITCSYNELTDLFLSELFTLGVTFEKDSWLDCSHNKIKLLDLRGLEVNSVNCSYNDMEDLWLSSDYLDWINCSNNQLIEIDFKDCIRISKIICSTNKLEKVNLRNSYNWRMKSIDFLHNPDLTCIAVDDDYFTEAEDWAVPDPDDWFQSDVTRVSYTDYCTSY